jgi:hypothetical protein
MNTKHRNLQLISFQMCSLLFRAHLELKIRILLYPSLT